MIRLITMGSTISASLATLAMVARPGIAQDSNEDVDYNSSIFSNSSSTISNYNVTASNESESSIFSVADCSVVSPEVKVLTNSFQRDSSQVTKKGIV